MIIDLFFTGKNGDKTSKAQNQKRYYGNTSVASPAGSNTMANSEESRPQSAMDTKDKYFMRANGGPLEFLDH